MSLLRTKYAGEVAVLSTWLCALLPWSLTWASQAGVSAIWFRFVPGRFLFIVGAEIPGQRILMPVWAVPDFLASDEVTLAAYVWLAGSVVFLGPFVLSIAFYLRDGAVRERVPAPVRSHGVLLVLSGLIFVASTVLYRQHQFGSTVPVGAVFQLAFGVILLRVERV